MSNLLNVFSSEPTAQSTPLQLNTLRINENLKSINEWIISIKEQAKNIQNVVQEAQQANTLNRNNNCTKYLQDINENVNVLIDTINSGDPLPAPFNNLPKVDNDNAKTLMTTGGYYYPSTSSRGRNRRKRRNKRTRR